MYKEQVLLEGGIILEILFASQSDWKLILRKGAKRLVEYTTGSSYEFKSVEKLRYDFERDLEDALRKG